MMRLGLLVAAVRATLAGDYRIAIDGQSNAQGLGRRAYLGVSPLSAYPDLVTFDGAAFDRVYIWNSNNTYQKLLMGVNNLGDGGGAFGPEFGLAVRWMKETTTGNLYIDKLAASGKPIEYFQYGDASGHFYEITQRNTLQNNWLAANGRNPKYAGWLWVQGEGNSPDSEAQYLASLETYINSRIQYNVLPASAKRLLAQIPVNSIGYGAGVAAAKNSYAASRPEARVFPYSSRLLADNVHLDEVGQVQMGYDAFELFFNKPHITV